MDKATVIAAIVCIIVIVAVIVLLVFSLRTDKKSASAPAQGKRNTANATAGSKEKISKLRRKIPYINNNPGSGGDTVFLHSGWHVYTQDPQQDPNADWVDQGIVSRSEWKIGRNQECDVCIPKQCISDQHIVIGRNRNREWYVQNLSGSTGTIYLGYQGDSESYEMALNEKIQLSPGADAEYYFLMGEVYLALVWQNPAPMNDSPIVRDTQSDSASSAEQQERYEQGFGEFTGSGCGHSSVDDL